MEFLTDFHQLHGVWRHHCSTTAESWLNLQQPEKYCLFWYPNTWVVTCHVETNCCNISPKNFWWQTSTLAHKNLISWGHSDGHHAKSGLKEMLERHRNSRSILAWLLFYMSPLQLMDIHWYTEHMYIYTVRQRNKKHLWCHTSQVHRMILSLNEISRMKKNNTKKQDIPDLFPQFPFKQHGRPWNEVSERLKFFGMLPPTTLTRASLGSCAKKYIVPSQFSLPSHCHFCHCFWAPMPSLSSSSGNTFFPAPQRGRCATWQRNASSGARQFG